MYTEPNMLPRFHGVAFVDNQAQARRAGIRSRPGSEVKMGSNLEDGIPLVGVWADSHTAMGGRITAPLPYTTGLLLRSPRGSVSYTSLLALAAPSAMWGWQAGIWQEG